jgi:two-component system phosphate regulon response regulator PhoB
MSTRILLIDDEAPIRDMVRFALELSGLELLEAETAKQGLAIINSSDKPNLVLVDWMLEDQQGIDLAKQLKTHPDHQTIPVIMLTAKADEESKVQGLEAGADDYIVKPFSPRELIARIKAVLRRSQNKQHHQDEEAQELTLGDIRMDIAGQRLYLKGKLTKTGPLEYKLLSFLLAHVGKVYTRQQILDHVWSNVYVSERTIDVHIRRLRKILGSGQCQDYIRTVRGSGYCLSLPET